MENAVYSSKNGDGLYELLRQFLPENGRDLTHASQAKDVNGQVEKDAEAGGEIKAELIQGTCTYCGMRVAHMSIDIGGFQDSVCPLCKEELVQQKDLFYQIVDETVYNVKYMCSIPWDKSIRVQKCSELKKPSPKAAKTRKKKKKAASAWVVCLKPRFMQAEIDEAQKMCTFKIRTAIPAGVVVALTVYTVVYAYLHLAAESKKLNCERMTGLSYWYMVHYLHCIDYERYACHYNQVIEQCIPKSGVALYRNLQEKRSNQSSQVFSILQDLALARQPEEERLTAIMRTILHQNENKVAPDTHKTRND